MKIVKFLLMVLVAVVIVVILGGFLLSGEYFVERSIIIDAPAEQVHYFVGDLANWDQWTPWVESDPTLVTTIGDRSTGVGASQSWTGKDGKGDLTFTRCDAGGVEYEMAFQPDENTRWPARSAMLYTSDGDTTTVRWSMSGKLDGFVGKYFALAMPGFISKDFDKGLAKLKTKAEALPPVLEESAPVEAPVPAVEGASAG